MCSNLEMHSHYCRLVQCSHHPSDDEIRGRCSICATFASLAYPRRTFVYLDSEKFLENHLLE